MKKVNNFVLALLLISTIVPAAIYAAAPTPQWQVDFTGLWLNTAGDNTYGQSVPSGSNTQLLVSNPKSNFNYKIAVTYFTADQDTWYLSFLNYAPKWQTNAASTVSFEPPISYSGKDSLQQTDFQHGYVFHVHQNLNINLHAGFSYLQATSSAILHGPIDTADLQFLQGQSSFTGLGPTVGLSLERQLGYNFVFSNAMNLGIAYGTITAQSTSIDDEATVKSSSTAAHPVFVPHVDLNLALGYHAQVSTTQIIQADLGFEFRQLFNVANAHNGASSSYDNVGFYGPYLKLSYLF